MKLEPELSTKIIVVGIPRSGTTLVSNLIHSAENAFCLSEPHHEYNGAKRVSFDKVEGMASLQDYGSNPERPMETIVQNVMNRGNFVVGGFKETYRGPSWPKEIRNDGLISAYVDAGYKLICIVRDPVRAWNSQKACTGDTVFHDMDRFIANYHSLLGIVKNPLCYETFIKNPEQEFLAKTGIRVSGGVSLRATTFKMGDGFARTSHSVVDRKLTDITTAEEKLRLEPLRNYYRSIVIP